MIRRLLFLFTVLAACFVVTSPVSVGASTGSACVPGPSACSQTIHFSSQPLFAAPLPCSPLAGWNVINEDNGWSWGSLHHRRNWFRDWPVDLDTAAGFEF